MSTKRRLRLYLASACILIAGMLGAVALYVGAAGRSDSDGEILGYEFVDGVAYPVRADESKAYRNDLERFGGKSAVFADDVQRWFSNLWHGKPLAYTVAVLSVLAALVCFRAARRQRD